MRRPEIGETLYQCGYALSGRAKCKACGEKIEQAALRIGYTTPGEGDYDMTAWHHHNCAAEEFPFVVSPEENLESAEDIYGFDGLNEADQQMLTEVRTSRSNATRRTYRCDSLGGLSSVSNVWSLTNCLPAP
jgi:hypothetical protein